MLGENQSVKFRDSEGKPLKGEVGDIWKSGPLESDSLEIVRTTYVAPVVHAKIISKDGRILPNAIFKGQNKKSTDTMPFDAINSSRLPDGRCATCGMIPNEEMTLTASAEGYKPQSVDLSLPEGAVKEMTFAIEPADAKDAPPAKEKVEVANAPVGQSVRPPVLPSLPAQPTLSGENGIGPIAVEQKPKAIELLPDEPLTMLFVTEIQSESLQKDLNLTDTQKERLIALSNATGEAFGKEGSSMSENIRVPIVDKAFKELREILSSKQLDRAKEILIQYDSSMAFDHEDIVKALELTDTQKSTIHGIMQKGRKSL